MSETLSYYAKQAQRLPHHDLPAWWREAREAGRLYCQSHGFPTRHDEDWKYTPIQPFLDQNFEHAQLQKQSATTAYHPATCKDHHAGYLEFAIIHGCIIGIEAIASQLPAGVLVLPLSQLSPDASALLERHSTIQPPAHAFQALNAALFSDG